MIINIQPDVVLSCKKRTPIAALPEKQYCIQNGVGSLACLLPCSHAALSKQVGGGTMHAMQFEGVAACLKKHNIASFGIL